MVVSRGPPLTQEFVNFGCGRDRGAYDDNCARDDDPYGWTIAGGPSDMWVFMASPTVCVQAPTTATGPTTSATASTLLLSKFVCVGRPDHQDTGGDGGQPVSL